jgi:hypothetical protein
MTVFRRTNNLKAARVKSAETLGPEFFLDAGATNLD